MFKVKSNKPKPGKTLNTAICRAVRERRRVLCVYGGEERLIEPHCHGHSKSGGEVLSALQPDGAAGREAGWKMFDVSKIERFDVTDEHFAMHSEFNREHPGVTQVHCLVD